MKRGEKSLSIDTTAEVGRVCLNEDCVTWKAQGNVEVVLEKIDQVLKKSGSEHSDITAIKVNPGPGSFTGTRVGVAVANTLAWTLGITVNGKKPPIAVQYGTNARFAGPARADLRRTAR